MAAPSRATLLFRRHEPEPELDEDDRPSLDSVGTIAVLEAMREQRTSSLPPPPSPDESGERPRVDRKSIGFMKIR